MIKTLAKIAKSDIQMYIVILLSPLEAAAIISIHVAYNNNNNIMMSITRKYDQCKCVDSTTTLDLVYSVTRSLKYSA